MASTTGKPTMTAAIAACAKPGSTARTALMAFKNDQALTREQIRLVQQHWGNVLAAFKVQSGVYV